MEFTIMQILQMHILKRMENQEVKYYMDRNTFFLWTHQTVLR